MDVVNKARIITLRVAAVCGAILGLGFGIPAVIGAAHFASTGEIWLLAGMPTYGDGPLEAWGVPTSTPLIAGFAVVCALEVVDAVLLWRGKLAGAVLSLVLLPFGLVYWIGFALPFAFPAGLAQAILVIVALLQWARWDSGPRPADWADGT
jgi:hypothetical protein